MIVKWSTEFSSLGFENTMGSVFRVKQSFIALKVLCIVFLYSAVCVNLESTAHLPLFLSFSLSFV